MRNGYFVGRSEIYKSHFIYVYQLYETIKIRLHSPSFIGHIETYRRDQIIALKYTRVPSVTVSLNISPFEDSCCQLSRPVYRSLSPGKLFMKKLSFLGNQFKEIINSVLKWTRGSHIHATSVQLQFSFSSVTLRGTNACEQARCSS